MKLLVVDVGNTSTAVGLWDSGRVGPVAHVDVHEAGQKVGSGEVGKVGCGDDERARRVERLIGCPISALDGFSYVSVVPSADEDWARWAKGQHLAFHQVTAEDFCTSPLLTLDYPDPSSIGADRLADAAGAVSRYGAPVLVMDFGTALTAAVVTEDRVWRGGVIAPGFPLMRDYLFERTAKLPRMKLPTYAATEAGATFDIPKIGRSTEEAMRFGALVGYRGMAREIVTELSKNFSTDFKLVATGGFAPYALRDIGLPFTIDPTLTLYGAGLVGAEKWKEWEK